MSWTHTQTHTHTGQSRFKCLRNFSSPFIASPCILCDIKNLHRIEKNSVDVNLHSRNSKHKIGRLFLFLIQMQTMAILCEISKPKKKDQESGHQIAMCQCFINWSRGRQSNNLHFRIDFGWRKTMKTHTHIGTEQSKQQKTKRDKTTKGRKKTAPQNYSIELVKENYQPQITSKC